MTAHGYGRLRALTATAPGPDRGRHARVFVATALAGVAADQAGKAWAVAHLNAARPLIAVGLLHLELSRNPGASFGLGRGLTPWITAVSLAAVIALAVAGPRAPSRAWALVAGLIAAGAAGNAVDRFVRSPGPGQGAVVDWIKVPFYGPVFNLADVALRVGLLCALALVLGAERQRRFEPRP